jgi:mannosyl-oligosaccharide alpha-1,2-mannosidase
MRLNFEDPHEIEWTDVGMDELVNSSFEWASLARRWPVINPTDLLRGRLRSQPRIQAEDKENGIAYNSQLEVWRQEVKHVFLKGWKNYKKYAWMRDELAPVSGKGE